MAIYANTVTLSCRLTEVRDNSLTGARSSVVYSVCSSLARNATDRIRIEHVGPGICVCYYSSCSNFDVMNGTSNVYGNSTPYKTAPNLLQPTYQSGNTFSVYNWYVSNGRIVCKNVAYPIAYPIANQISKDFHAMPIIFGEFPAMCGSYRTCSYYCYANEQETANCACPVYIYWCVPSYLRNMEGGYGLPNIDIVKCCSTWNCTNCVWSGNNSRYAGICDTTVEVCKCYRTTCCCDYDEWEEVTYNMRCEKSCLPKGSMHMCIGNWSSDNKCFDASVRFFYKAPPIGEPAGVCIPNLYCGSNKWFLKIPYEITNSRYSTDDAMTNSSGYLAGQIRLMTAMSSCAQFVYKLSNKSRTYCGVSLCISGSGYCDPTYVDYHFDYDDCPYTCYKINYSSPYIFGYSGNYSCYYGPTPLQANYSCSYLCFGSGYAYQDYSSALPNSTYCNCYFDYSTNTYTGKALMTQVNLRICTNNTCMKTWYNSWTPTNKTCFEKVLNLYIGQESLTGAFYLSRYQIYGAQMYSNNPITTTQCGWNIGGVGASTYGWTTLSLMRGTCYLCAPIYDKRWSSLYCP